VNARGRAAVRVRQLPLLLLPAAALLTAWAFVVPVFEAPDEYLHWQYARHLHDHASLPIYSEFFAEGNSPPLYYTLIAPIATRMSTPPPVIWADGTGQLVKPFEPRLHMNASGDLWRYWPIRWARLLTVLMSLITIVVCARLGSAAEAGTGDDADGADGAASTALLTAGFVAFLPQFAFRGSHVNNDALLTTMAACTLWGMVVMMRRGFTWRVGALTAVALAAAYLSKISAICLAPALALVMLMDGGTTWRVRVTRLVGAFAIVLAIVAPWSIRNLMLYGDPFASAAMDHAVSGIMYERSLWDWHHVTTLPRELFKSFVGAFGFMGVKLHRGIYAIYLLFLLVAFAGLVKRSVREPWIARLAVVLAAIVVCNFAIVVNINLRFDQPQGRYMFPALPAVMLAAALGLRGWRPWRPGLTLTMWGAANVAILLFVVRPIYDPPLVASVSRAVRVVEASPSAATQPWTADLSVPVSTADANFISFEVEPRGDRPAGTTTGTIVATLERSDPSPQPSPRTRGEGVDVTVPFQWRGGGVPFPVTVMMLKDPRWNGRVTRVSVRWPDGASLAIRNFRLMGSLPSHDF
jgi:4-amino-4-deoxy-L-arabinose transferase-like glycosyltransferase